MDFMLYCFYNQVYKADELGMSKKAKTYCNLGIWAIEKHLRGICTKEFARSKHFTPHTPIKEIASLCSFNSLDVFFRQFRKITGMTPAEYRRKFSL